MKNAHNRSLLLLGACGVVATLILMLTVLSGADEGPRKNQKQGSAGVSPTGSSSRSLEPDEKITAALITLTSTYPKTGTVSINAEEASKLINQRTALDTAAISGSDDVKSIPGVLAVCKKPFDGRSANFTLVIFPGGDSQILYKAFKRFDITQLRKPLVLNQSTTNPCD